MQNGAKFPGIPAEIFLKTYSREFPNGLVYMELKVFRIDFTLRVTSSEATIQNCGYM